MAAPTTFLRRERTLVPGLPRLLTIAPAGCCPASPLSQLDQNPLQAETTRGRPLEGTAPCHSATAGGWSGRKPMGLQVRELYVHRCRGRGWVRDNGHPTMSPCPRLIPTRSRGMGGGAESYCPERGPTPPRARPKLACAVVTDLAAVLMLGASGQWCNAADRRCLIGPINQVLPLTALRGPYVSCLVSLELIPVHAPVPRRWPRRVHVARCVEQEGARSSMEERGLRRAGGSRSTGEELELGVRSRRPQHLDETEY